MEIYRDILVKLKEWKNREDRKPLLLFGARQTGKTWVLRKFGEQEFEHCAYFNFDEEVRLGELFEGSKDPNRIVEQLSHQVGFVITPVNTLFIFDEIQACPKAIESLKYFCEKAPDYAITAAGSLLGITLGHHDFSFPVGKVDHLDLYPVSFSEFLRASDKSLFNYYLSIDSPSPIPQIFFDRLSEAFKAYRICGGMPAAVVAMLNGEGRKSDHVLSDILKDYTLDFVKHATPLLASRIRHLWESIPLQLAKENRKFFYSVIRTGARAREYEDALIWLKNAGLIYQVPLCSKPFLPLKAYDQLNNFKIYAADIGILRVLSELSFGFFDTAPAEFREYKGALTENYVLQSLVCQYGKTIRYWSSGNEAEIEFIIQNGTDVIPVEVKSSLSVKAKSLAVYDKTYNPKLRIRFSKMNLKQTGNLVNIPLFLADRTKTIVQGIIRG